MSVHVQTTKVLQVIASLDPNTGGPPTSAVATSLALRGRGFANTLAYVDVPSCSAAAQNVETLRQAGICVLRFPVTRVAGGVGVRWGISVRLALWILRHGRQFDVIHTHGAWTFTTAVGLLAAKLHRRVAVMTPHESLTNFDRSLSGPVLRVVKWLLRKAYLHGCDCIVVASELEQRDSGDPRRHRTVMVSHAVRPLHLEPRSHSATSLLRVGFLARLHPKKNLEVIIEAIARLGEEVELVVAGDGPEAYREALKALAVELGVSHRVAWLGFVDAKGKAEFLAQIDVLAMPSAYECFGVAAVEAMSTGVPLIVSPSVGVADIAARHGAALVVNPDPEHLAIAIARYASDRALLESAKQAARAAAQEFSPERHGERLESEYLRLISTSKNREFLREEGRHEVAG